MTVLPIRGMSCRGDGCRTAVVGCVRLGSQTASADPPKADSPSAKPADQAAKPAQPPPPIRTSGKTSSTARRSTGWKAPQFGGEGKVYVKDGTIVMETGSMMTGITWTGEAIRNNYELDAGRHAAGRHRLLLHHHLSRRRRSLLAGRRRLGRHGRRAVERRRLRRLGKRHHQDHDLQGQPVVSRADPRDRRGDRGLDRRPTGGRTSRGRTTSSTSASSAISCRPLGICTWDTTGAVRNIRVRADRSTGEVDRLPVASIAIVRSAADLHCLHLRMSAIRSCTWTISNSTFWPSAPIRTTWKSPAAARWPSWPQQGHRVGIVDLTDGEPTPGSPGPEVRLAEARRAAEVLGVVAARDARSAQPPAVRHVRGPRGAGQGVPQVPAAAGDRAGRQDAHRLARPLPGVADHRGGRLLREADQVGRAFRRPAAVRRCRAGWNVSWRSTRSRRPTAATMVVDIGDTLEKKLAAIACYASQFPPTKAHYLDNFRAFALQQGMAAGFAAGEVLASPTAWGTRDLMGLLFGS